MNAPEDRLGSVSQAGAPRVSICRLAASPLLPQDRPTARNARYCCISSRCPAVHQSAAADFACILTFTFALPALALRCGHWTFAKRPTIGHGRSRDRRCDRDIFRDRDRLRDIALFKRPHYINFARLIAPDARDQADQFDLVHCFSLTSSFRPACLP
jgi:hypothetical protein